jgi:peptidase E
MTQPKPIFLLADSQLLFWKYNGNFLLNRILDCLDKDKKIENIKASYIGASNGDNPVYFDIFVEVMKQKNITNCRMIPSNPDVSDIDFLNLSDIILLAGGDVKKGLEVFKQNGIDKIIPDKYHKGSILIGVSAGAVQVGANAWGNKNEDNGKYIDTFKIIPYIIDVHNEKNDWAELNEVLKNNDNNPKGYGIPSGGGIIFHSDWSIEAVRHSLLELVKNENGDIIQSIILPPMEVDQS